MEKINVRNIYIELLNKIKNVQGVDKDYVDGLIELVDNEITALDSDINAITSVIPETASVSNQLATVNDIPDVTQIELDLQTLTASVSAIDLLIPSGASSSNKLATAADIPAVHEPLYNTFTIDHNYWGSTPLPDGYYHQGGWLTDHFNLTAPPLVFVVPASSSDIEATASEKAAFNLINVFQFDDYAAQGKTYLEVLAKTPPTSDVKIGISGNT